MLVPRSVTGLQGTVMALPGRKVRGRPSGVQRFADAQGQLRDMHACVGQLFDMDACVSQLLSFDACLLA